MASPTLSGLHHVKIPVGNLEASLDWYRVVFGAEHLAGLDHFDSDGAPHEPGHDDGKATSVERAQVQSSATT